jgi:outer membrane protein OmpA-like peptidoglycan-associated protein
MSRRTLAAWVLVGVLSVPAAAQVAPLPTGTNVAAQTLTAVSYGNRRGTTRMAFRGTELMPAASGEARIELQRGTTRIEARFTSLQNPTTAGDEFLTYILWAVSPDGRAFNLGEVPLAADRNLLTALLPGNRSTLTATTPLQTFALMVTLEPYYAVRAPSRYIVLENTVPIEVEGAQTTPVSMAGVESGYARSGFKFDPLLLRTNLPLDLFQARNAVRIAADAGAEEHAGAIHASAIGQLRKAEALASAPRIDRRALVSLSREAVQTAEDAREAAARRTQAARLEEERRNAAAREAEARAQAQADLDRRLKAEVDRAAADAQRQAAETERLTAERRREEADRQNREAQAAAAAAEQARAEAEARQAQALRQQQAAEAEAARTRDAAQALDQQLQQAIRDREDLRGTILQQLNLILETRDTARGLVVNLSDVTFGTGQATLQPGAREKLARVSGILASHPTLRLEVEGHTDSVGADAYNQDLSERRAAAVRNYLVQQGIPSSSIVSVGFGKTRPVATNDTAVGRQMHRRVELIVSGEEIGTHTR